MARTLSADEAKSIATVLEQAGLLIEGSADRTKTEAATVAGGQAVADNTLVGTKKIIASIRWAGITGAVAGGGAGVAAGFLEKNPTVVALGVLGAAIIISAWVIGVAWATQADVAARSRRAAAMLDARGVVAARLVAGMLEPEAPLPVAQLAPHDGEHRALLAALDDRAATVTLKSGKMGHVGDRFIRGDHLMFRLAGDPTVHHVDEIRDVKVAMTA